MQRSGRRMTSTPATRLAPASSPSFLAIAPSPQPPSTRAGHRNRSRKPIFMTCPTSETTHSIIPELNVAVVTAIGRPRTVLDLQCGRGLHGAVAKRAGAHVVGIEGRRDQAESARRIL